VFAGKINIHVNKTTIVFLVGILLTAMPDALCATELSRPALTDEAGAGNSSGGLHIINGWFAHKGRVIWGYAQHNGWWRAGQRPNLTRNALGQIGPNRTEDLEKLTDAMLKFAYPAFEHNFGLWYDRRRDAHDTARRSNAKAVAPFLEQPWRRSGPGQAWDGLPKYDLTRYNKWYFDRLRSFAKLCDSKGTILLHNTYMQHALLETDAHYVDFPWRPSNCLQNTEMPERNPAAASFYDVRHPVRRNLHRAYIRKCLAELGNFQNVVFMCSEEYTGPLSFMQFWLDTLIEWQAETGRDVHVAVGGCKDIVDAVLSDPIRSPSVTCIDLRYWWRKADGQLFAPQGGRNLPGRLAGAFSVKPNPGLYQMLQGYTDRGLGHIGPTSPEQIYRQTIAYRARYRSKALIHGIAGSRQAAWAFLMGGGSLMIGQLPYPKLADPSEYISPEECKVIQATYDFVRDHIAAALPHMQPCGVISNSQEPTWCIGHGRYGYLVYALRGNCFSVDLSNIPGHFQVHWFDPRQGILSPAQPDTLNGGTVTKFTSPSQADGALWLSPKSRPQVSDLSNILPSNDQISLPD
jgi:hypothetical protein